MLNKVKIGILIAAILTIVRMFLPDIAISEELQSAIVVIIVFASQFFVKENEVTVNRLKLKKKKARWSDGSLIFLALMLSATPSRAQELEFKDALALGGGSFFGEEETTFSADALFGAVQWRGLKLPFGASTGVGVEFSAELDTEGERGLVCRVWNLVRAKISERLYAGADTKILENRKANFDSRIIGGVLLGTIRENELVLEVYSLEENRPIAFAIFYRF